MTSRDVSLGARAPQQARSRETRAKLLAAAEHLLVELGADAITMAAVAERAEVSVGTVYRRFENKDLLLGAVKDGVLARLGDRLTARLSATAPDLRSVIEAYVAAVVDWMTESGRLLPEIVGIDTPKSPGARADGLAALRWRLLEAAAPHHGEVRHHDPDATLAFVGRTLAASAVHRALSVDAAPDGMTWPSWSSATVDMATAYLTTDPS